MAATTKSAASIEQAPSGTLVALQGFAGNLNGRLVTYAQGEPVSPTDPAVKKWPHLFGPIVVRQQGEPFHTFRRVEQATAAPGETRS